MTLDVYIYGLTVLGLAGIVIFSFFYSSFLRNVFLKVSYIIALVGVFVSIYTILGNPVPVNVVTRMIYYDVDRAVVVYYELNEDDSILMLLRVPNRSAPIWVRYPWDKKTAGKIEQLRREIDLKQAKRDQAQRDAARNGTPFTEEETDEQIVIKHPFDPSVEDREDRFKHESPTVAGPRKDDVLQLQEWGEPPRY